MKRYFLIPIISGGVLVTGFVRLFLDNSFVSYLTAMIFGGFVFYLFSIWYLKLIVKWSRFPFEEEKNEKLNKAYSFAYLPLFIYGLLIIFFAKYLVEESILNYSILAFSLCYLVFTFFIIRINNLDKIIKVKLLTISFFLVFFLFISPALLYIGMWMLVLGFR